MRRDVVRLIVIWVVLTALGLWIVSVTNFVPLAASEEAEDIDRAIRLLTLYSVPVAAFVLAVTGYSVFRRRTGEDGDDGPPLHGSRVATYSWLGVTAGLATLLFLNPGLTGLRALQAGGEPEMTIAVEGVQWHWNVTYPNGATVSPADELVLPVDRRVRFELTSGDVIHSFWVPAFRLKQDAVPGRTTTLTTTPNEVGSFDDDPNMRAQCAELCGTGHPAMRMAVRVVEPSEFDAYLASIGSGDATEMDMDSEQPTDDEMDMEMGSGTEMDMASEDSTATGEDHHDDQ